MTKDQCAGITRREFVGRIGVAGAALGLAGMAGTAWSADDLPRDADGKVIPGFGPDQHNPSPKVITESAGKWKSKTRSE